MSSPSSLIDPVPPPSLARIAVAHFSGIAGALACVPFLSSICAFASFALVMIEASSASSDMSLLTLSGIVVAAFGFIFLLGAGMAVFQWMILKQWIRRVWPWVLGYGLSTSVLLPASILAWGKLLERLSAGQSVPSDTPEQVFLAALPYLWFAAPLGMIAGLAVGAVQSLSLAAGKKLYLLVSSITWAILLPLLVFACVLFFVIVLGTNQF